MRSNAALIGLLLFAALPARAEEQPLSAIDWLSRSVTSAPAAMPVMPADPGPSTRRTPSAPGPLGPITTTPLGKSNPDSLGLLPPERSGLPRSLWGSTPTADLVRLVTAERVETLPAIQSLLMRLLLAEVDPPAVGDQSGLLFLARIDKLLDLGALDPALSLLEQLDHPKAEPFRRWFDIALLIGEEDRACEVMRATPDIAPTFPARIYCLARGGDWNAAALSLRTGEALGYIDGEMTELLTRFLDPELADGADDLPMPQRPSPLVFRLMEAIGQPMPTTTLPVAFAQADLRSNTGWKARLEAAERLARTGVIEPNQLLGLYTERHAAASGGIWDRVDAIQRFDSALTARDTGAVARTLPTVWTQMVAIELEVPFAMLYGRALADLGLTGEAGALAFRIGLLSDGYETVAQARTPISGDERFLIGLARGDVQGTTPPDQMGAAIRTAFNGAPVTPPAYQVLLTEKRLGEAILLAIDDVTEGARGDLRDVTSGLSLLRAVGLEAVARRAALELVLLERRG